MPPGANRTFWRYRGTSGSLDAMRRTTSPYAGAGPSSTATDPMCIGLLPFSMWRNAASCTLITSMPRPPCVTAACNSSRSDRRPFSALGCPSSAFPRGPSADEPRTRRLRAAGNAECGPGHGLEPFGGNRRPARDAAPVGSGVQAFQRHVDVRHRRVDCPGLVRIGHPPDRVAGGVANPLPEAEVCHLGGIVLTQCVHPGDDLASFGEQELPSSRIDVASHLRKGTPRSQPSNQAGLLPSVSPPGRRNGHRHMAICRWKATDPLSAVTKKRRTLSDVAPRSSDVHLTVLTRLGHSLPGIRSHVEAANEVVKALASLDVAAAVSAVESDMAIVMAVNVPATLVDRMSQQQAASMVGMRIPLDGVESLRQPVRLRRPYFGTADASETLRRLTNDSGFAKALPNAADERDVAAVPVTSRDKVVAVLSVWGPGCSSALSPTLEVVAAMLAGAWSAEARPTAERFDGPAFPAPDRRLRDTVTALVASGKIVAALQPIVRLVNDTVIGYEALARFPQRARIRTPDDLFGAAAALNMQSTVDLACVRAGLQAASNIGEADLFVNVLIGTLVDHSGVAALDRAVSDAKVDPAAVVLEFSEREPVPDLALLQRIAAELRARGFRIAVDDAGAGHASMRVIAELRPEFIKVDRSLITAIDADRARRALVVALLSFSGHIGARVIAEGIETQREQETLQSLGVQFGQGWLLGRPVLPHPLKGDTAMEVVDATWFAQRLVSPTRVASTGPEPAAPGAIAPVDTVAVTRPRRALARALSDAALALQSE